jgi:hypothetical protein
VQYLDQLDDITAAEHAQLDAARRGFLAGAGAAAAAAQVQSAAQAHAPKQ